MQGEWVGAQQDVGHAAAPAASVELEAGKEDVSIVARAGSDAINTTTIDAVAARHGFGTIDLLSVRVGGLVFYVAAVGLCVCEAASLKSFFVQRYFRSGS